MPESLKKRSVNPFLVTGVICLLVLLIFHDKPSIYYYLTIAQLLYVPLVVERVTSLAVWQKICIMLGQLSVTTNYFIDQPLLILIGSLMYVGSMFTISWSGIQRFLQRGFIHIEEVMIDVGLMYSVMAGAWYFAYVNQINTGFSEMITWLTAIHFHYSAMLLCITVGLIGRIAKYKLYTFSACVIAAGPMLVAIGITFSRIIEILSVSLYVISIFILTLYTFKIKDKMIYVVRLAFLTLSFTIIWSFLYAYSNLTNSDLVTIPDMLQFHGILNCIIFGSAITIAWFFNVPTTKHQRFLFPMSKVEGKVMEAGEPHFALVDDMAVFIDKKAVPKMLYDFYEHTNDYELVASVRWSTWFKPFAYVYQWISKWMKQINLPFSSKPMEMNGQIFKISTEQDERESPRVWQRKINDEIVFTAIYSVHQTQSMTYMNIALPLPKSTMHGILTVTAKSEKLYLTSDDDGDAGTYFTIGDYTMKLPLHEYFVLTKQGDKLIASHEMKIFGLKFLHIHYEISTVI